MANYSAAFGYTCYLIPLLSASVDTSFAGVTGGVGAGAGNFIDTTTEVAAADQVTYAAGVFSINTVAEPTDGTMNPVKLLGLTNASLETDTNTEDVLTYDDDQQGYIVSIATSKSWSVSLAGVADFSDAGYQILRITEQNTVADSLRVKFARVGPTGTVETVYGYGTVSGYTESVEAGSIVSWEAEIMGYGPYVLELDENGTAATGGIATVSGTTTQIPFALSGSGVAVTLTGNATATVDTDGSGNITAVNITGAGSGYSVGDLVYVGEAAGDGVGYFNVATIA